MKNKEYSTLEYEWEKEILKQLEKEDKALEMLQAGVIFFLVFCLGLALGYQASM